MCVCVCIYIYIYIYILACRIPGTVWSTGSPRVRNDWVPFTSLHFIHTYMLSLSSLVVCWLTLSLLPCLGCYLLLWTLECIYLFKLEFSPGTCPGVGLLDHMVVLFLVFQGTSILFSIVAAPIYILTSSVEGLPFLHTLSSIYYL